MHCQSIGKKGSFKRIMNEGIKYECGTQECFDALTQRELKEQRELEAAQEIIRQERYLANLPYAYFIDAEKQYRDCNRRCIDPYKKIIYRFSKCDPIWEETNEVLTFTDNINADAYVNAHHDMNIIADTNNDDAYIADINDDDDDAYIADTNSDAVANSDANSVANANAVANAVANSDANYVANAVAKSDAEELERLYIKHSLPMSFAMNYQTEHGINSDDHAFYGKPSLLEYVKSYVTNGQADY
tara:strand:+ start:200 stop:934 length:735 start_codon:yes stop_codon:yes gene_type:complete